MKLTSHQKEILRGAICPYCDRLTTRVKAAEIYGDVPFADQDFLLCRPCWAYVGVHKSSGIALGRVANLALREKRSAAHRVFDRLYKEGYLTRSAAYRWLSCQLDIPKKYTHIAMFGEKTCDRIVEIVPLYLEELRQLKVIMVGEDFRSTNISSI
jgi:zinc-finger-containing domain